MRFLIKAIFALAVLTGLALGAAAFLVPEDVIRDQVTALVRQQTGRELTVRGRTAFTFYPSIGVEMDDVALSNPPDMGGAPLLRMESLNVNLRLLPLLTRNVEVERFVLVRPIVNLHVDRSGRKNWEFSARYEPGKPRFVHAQLAPSAGGGLKGIQLGSAKVTDGVVLYTDERTGGRQQLDAVNVTVTQGGAREPVVTEGSLVWRGEKVSFNGRLGSLQALTNAAPSAVEMTVAARDVKGEFKGRIAFAGSPAANGMLSAATPSIRELAEWTGSPLPPGRGFGPAAVSGQLDYKAEAISFDKAKLSLDGMNGQGSAVVMLKGTRPHIQAALGLDRLDLNIYTGQGDAPPRAQPAPQLRQPAPQAQPGPKPKEGQSLTDFIEQLNKQDQGAPAPQVRGWSQRAIDYSGLRAVDADVKLTAGQIHYQRIKTGQSALNATLREGVLTANLSRMALYGGSGTGRVTLNGAREVPAFAVQFSLDDVSALPLLKDAMTFDWVSGTAKMAVNLSGAGRSESEMVRTLQGNGSVNFSNGAIEGINIPAMVRGIKQGRFDGWKRNEREKTDFNQLTGTFTIQNGVASNSDLEMVGPLIRMKGRGTVHVPREHIDYSLVPRVVASLEGQGATVDKSGIPVPVRIRGRWDNPSVEPDVEAILENPDAAAEAVNKVIQKFGGKKVTGEQVEQLLQGVLGGGQDGQDGQSGEKAKDILKNLFKKN